MSEMTLLAFFTLNSISFKSSTILLSWLVWSANAPAVCRAHTHTHTRTHVRRGTTAYIAGTQGSGQGDRLCCNAAVASLRCGRQACVRAANELLHGHVYGLFACLCLSVALFLCVCVCVCVCALCVYVCSPLCLSAMCPQPSALLCSASALCPGCLAALSA